MWTHTDDNNGNDCLLAPNTQTITCTRHIQFRLLNVKILENVGISKFSTIYVIQKHKCFCVVILLSNYGDSSDLQTDLR